MDFTKGNTKAIMSDTAVITVFTHHFQADVCNFRSEDIELPVSVRLSSAQLRKRVGNQLYRMALNALKVLSPSLS